MSLAQKRARITDLVKGRCCETTRRSFLGHPLRLPEDSSPKLFLFWHLKLRCARLAYQDSMNRAASEKCHQVARQFLQMRGERAKSAAGYRQLRRLSQPR